MDLLITAGDYLCRPYLTLGVCESCVIRAGMNYYETKFKKQSKEVKR